MRLTGKALGKQLEVYLDFRAQVGEPTRILLTDYPTGVLHAACEYLIEAAEDIQDGALQLKSGRTGYSVWVAMMQPLDREGLKPYRHEGRGVSFGASAGHLVALRNRQGNVVIAVPLELWEECPESIKANTFQAFHQNRKYGTELEVFKCVAAEFRAADEAGQAPDQRLLAEVLRTVRAEIRDQGTRAEEKFLSGIDQLCENFQQNGILDLRLIGLLPDDLLATRLQDGTPEQVRRRVAENFAWQSTLVAGLAQSQRRFLVKKYGDSEHLGDVEEFVARRGFRLLYEDFQWRRDWPANLSIHTLGSGQRKPTRVVIRDLRFDTPVALVLDVPIVLPNARLCWRLGSSLASLAGEILVDGEALQSVDLTKGYLDALDLDSDIGGLHTLALASRESTTELSGETELAFFVAGAGGGIVGGLEGSKAGREHYQVDYQSSVRVVWDTVPGTPDVVLYRVTFDSPESEFQKEVRGIRYADVTEGIARRTEVTIEGIDAGGDTVVATSFSVSPRRGDAGADVLRPSTVGQALVLAANEVGSHDVDRDKYDASVVRADDHYEVLLREKRYGEALAFKCLPSESPLLDGFESDILANGSDPWPQYVSAEPRGRTRAFVLREFEGASDWRMGTDQGAWDGFLAARTRLFEKLRSQGGSRWAELGPILQDVADYARAYRTLLEPLATNDTDVGPGTCSLAMIDCVVVPREEYMHSAYRPELDRSPVAILVSPLHPLRLARACAFEMVVREWLAAESPWAISGLLELDATHYPPCLVDWHYEHFHSASGLADGRWTMLLPETERDADLLLPADLTRQLGVDGSAEQYGAAPKDIANSIAHYHALHSFRRAIRVGYVNPGTGESLLEALELLVAKKVVKGGELVRRNASKCTYELALIPASDEEETRLGSAFDNYALLSDPDEELLKRVIFSRPPPGVHRRSSSQAGDPPRFHVLFGTGVVGVTGRNVKIEHIASAPGVRGLAVRPRRSFEAGPPPEVISQILVSKPDTVIKADLEGENPDLGRLMHALLFCLQCIGAATSDNHSASWSRGRAMVASINAQGEQEIQHMHQDSEWVCMMDSHVDVEYFDSPKQADHYVIDYVPSLVSERASRAHSQSSYVITTTPEHNVPIRAAVNRFLHAAYGHALPEHCSGRLESAVNRISGRLLLKLTGHPSAAKGATGMGLTCLLFESIKERGVWFPEGAMRARLLVAVDEYAPRWLQKYREYQGPAVGGTHADLIDISIAMGDSLPQLQLQMIEVKNQQGGGRALVDSAASQVAATCRMLDALFGIGSQDKRADREIQDLELAEMIDFHLRRTAMQTWDGQDREWLERVRRCRAALRERIAKGEYQASWRNESSELRGCILHFDPSIEGPTSGDATVPECIPVDGALVAYVPFSRDDVLALLGGRGLQYASRICQWLNPEWSPDLAEAREHEAAGTERRPSSEAGSVESSCGPESLVTAGESEGMELPEEEEEAEALPGDLAKVRLAFDGFVGNEAAVKRLQRFVLGALRQDVRRIKVNLALTGPASVGKTMLSKRIARALELPYLGCEGPTLVSVDDLLDRMEREVVAANGKVLTVGHSGGMPVREFPPMVVFIDEAHEIKEPLQQALLTLLEPKTSRVTGKNYVAQGTNVSWVLATTDWGDLIKTLQTRLIQLKLEPYTVEEVALIVAGQYPRLPPSVLTELAVAGRLVPRVALQRAEELDNAWSIEPDTNPEDLVDVLYDEWGIDDEGTDQTDIEYLQFLDREGKAVGVQRIANQLNIGTNELERNIEPYLVHKGFIQMTGGGRQISQLGRSHLRRRRR